MVVCPLATTITLSKSPVVVPVGADTEMAVPVDELFWVEVLKERAINYVDNLVN